MSLRKDNGFYTWSLVTLVVLFFSLFLLYPLVYMLKGAFGGQGEWTLRYFWMLMQSPLQRESLVNSLVLASLTTVVTSLIAFPLAHYMTRYSFRGKVLLGGLLLTPMILPPFVGAIGLRQLLARFGVLNLMLVKMGVVAPDQTVDWLGDGGFLGIVLLQSFNLYPILFLNLTAAMSQLDPSLREAAQNLGAGSWRLFRTVTLPLIMPGYFAGAVIVFIWSFADLGTPLIFGFSRVVPIQIYDSISELNTNPMGYALVVFVLLLTVALFLASKRVLAGNRYDMMGRGAMGTGEVPATRIMTLCLWLGLGGMIGVALLPHLMVVAVSLSDRWFFAILPQHWTADNYRQLWDHGLTMSSIRNSLFYASLSTVVDLVLGVLIAWMITRKRLPGAAVLDALAMLPLALPGLVLAFGYMAGFDVPWKWLNPRYNPAFLLIISYSVRRLPYMVRAAYAGFQQASITLEEASANLGASPWRTLRKITLPLVMAHLAAGAILTFCFAMLEVSDSIILATREVFFPITKMIWLLIGRVDPNAPGIACALGVAGMMILMVSLFLASRILGRQLGQLFKG
jgi:iron(III) transport system permease protein